MKSQNKIYLKGHLGVDPQIIEEEGNRYGKLSVATNESYKDKITGEYKQKTQWHGLCVFNKTLIDRVLPILKKGYAVSIEGELRSYETQDEKGNSFRVTQACIGYAGDLVKIQKEETA